MYGTLEVLHDQPGNTICIPTPVVMVGERMTVPKDGKSTGEVSSETESRTYGRH
jgi:hypothetical protein